MTTIIGGDYVRPARGPKTYNYSEIFGRTFQGEGHYFINSVTPFGGQNGQSHKTT